MSRLVNFTANINFKELDERIQQILHYDGEQRRRDETVELLEEISKETTENHAIQTIGLSVDMMMLSDWAAMIIMEIIWVFPLKASTNSRRMNVFFSIQIVVVYLIIDILSIRIKSTP